MKSVKSGGVVKNGTVDGSAPWTNRLLKSNI